DSEGGDIGLYQLTFDAEEVLLETGKTPRELNWTWYIYEHDGAGTIIGPTLGDGTWDPDTGKVTITFSTEVAILSGDTMNLVLTAPVSFTSSVDTSSLTMRLANDVEFEPVAAASAVERGIVWNDRSNSSHSFDTDDWTNSYTLDYLPADYFTATE
ncbi:MAG: hypothetical protein Q8P27_02095, partial [Candidatus Peregrinibacteria bacterium]|nr:hypothetical protein [Candidatus Peregrinibacteria bacterium]